MQVKAARVLHCREKQLRLDGHTKVMGILNVTPDSFSDGGRYNTVEQAVLHAKQLVADGADLIDIGGESTRPGSAVVSLEAELARVIPIVQALKAEVDVPLSIDTYKAEVARQALEAGAHLINDIWGLAHDPAMADVVAGYRCPVVIMHNRQQINYEHFLSDVRNDLLAGIERALCAGIAEEQIIVDPGIGFAKTHEHNLRLMKHMSEVVSLGYPVLLGTSRKRVIHQTLQLPPTDVVEGTIATVVMGIMAGCQLVRVHDVREVKRAAQMTDAIIGSDV